MQYHDARNKEKNIVAIHIKESLNGSDNDVN